MSGVTWIPWDEEHNVLAKYKKDCTFCCNPAVAAACTGDGFTFATIRCCYSDHCRALATKLALGLVKEPETPVK
jgi:hypothetical protein